VTLYAESSAVLAWLLGEPSWGALRDMLGRARLVTASALTLLECERALVRAAVGGRAAGDEASAARALLAGAAAHWIVADIDAVVLARAGEPFPAEPIRTLDAIHLATALLARAALPDLTVLSLDRRVRACAMRLGFRVLPA
jgi:predicted nucleic acid-binding protein